MTKCMELFIFTFLSFQVFSGFSYCLFFFIRINYYFGNFKSDLMQCFVSYIERKGGKGEEGKGFAAKFSFVSIIRVGSLWVFSLRIYQLE